MKKLMFICAIAVFVAAGTQLASAQSTQQAAAPFTPNFGDYRSVTLATKAWQALADGNLEGVLAYTNKCIELYGEQARTMQAGLKDFVTGDDQKIFGLWALNDVATSLFIQGEAYRKAGQKDKAKAAFERIIKEFSFGQCYDTKNKSFWKPVDGAKDKIDMMDKGLDLDFGDMTSAAIAKGAWAALAKKDLEAVKAYVDKNLQLYGQRGKEMQASLKEFPWESPEKIFSYWALNDVATCLFIQGEAYRKANMLEEAKAAYQKIIDQFSYGQCWDAGGWFWKPAEGAKEKIAMIESGSNLDFGDYSSATLTTKAWQALNNNDAAGVEAYTNKCIELYASKAKEMQASLTEYAWESKEKIFSYWALNDVGTCYFIKGEAAFKAGDKAKAKEAYQKVINDYFYAQSWDPQGWFWKPAEGAQQKIEELSPTK
jgi:tetratricopeptide (TPR) repeat protein